MKKYEFLGVESFKRKIENGVLWTKGNDGWQNLKELDLTGLLSKPVKEIIESLKNTYIYVSDTQPEESHGLGAVRKGDVCFLYQGDGTRPIVARVHKISPLIANPYSVRVAKRRWVNFKHAKKCSDELTQLFDVL